MGNLEHRYYFPWVYWSILHLAGQSIYRWGNISLLVPHLHSFQLTSLKVKNLQGSLRWVETRLRRDMAVDVDRQRMIITPVLRLVFSLTSLVDTSDFLEVGFFVPLTMFWIWYFLWIFLATLLANHPYWSYDYYNCDSILFKRKSNVCCIDVSFCLVYNIGEE